MNYLKKIHPSYYGIFLFGVIVCLLIVFANLGRGFVGLREVAFALFPLMLVLGIVGIVKAKRWMQYLVSIACILIAAPFSYALKNVVQYSYSPTDSIFSTLSGDNTVWTKGYSKDNFSMVEVGMSENEVLSLLGEPLLVDERKSGKHWFYTSGPRGKVQGQVRGSTHIRKVIFKSNLVVSKESSFYID